MARFSTIVAFDARVDLAPLSPLVPVRRLLVLVVPAWPCLVIIGSFVLWLVLLHCLVNCLVPPVLDLPVLIFQRILSRYRLEEQRVLLVICKERRSIPELLAHFT